jgi:hypothetical protein
MTLRPTRTSYELVVIGADPYDLPPHVMRTGRHHRHFV